MFSLTMLIIIINFLYLGKKIGVVINENTFSFKFWKKKYNSNFSIPLTLSKNIPNYPLKVNTTRKEGFYDIHSKKFCRTALENNAVVFL